ncbi:ferredoxin reductase family protein [Sphingomonas quercus]|uniref:Ferric reductase-like transmembrane domain-containing protein n=1 Tax=Sphingomonas quercus TaxID=2842451 RepID=A0ABS6BP69_9SPHN|nr:ferric reductase-like transmembrane domain-containing protein [Sphingomonas quercus]MBU3079206.1 ferric reductase-like transmembrane domain-containing protein [Sphingomonas quercus]
MRKLRWTLWSLLGVTTLLWLLADRSLFQTAGFFAVRTAMVQYSGILAIAFMSVAMILAIRPRWPERWLDGLDKMYRLHKWLGIGALVLAIVHWLWAQAPKWAVGLGWMARRPRVPRAASGDAVEPLFASFRHTAEMLGEWAFYAAVLLIALALVRRIPYHIFARTHWLLALVYGVLVVHSVVLVKPAYWASPLGLMLAALLGYASWATLLILTRLAGRRRQVSGEITAIRHYPGVRSVAVEIEVAKGWPGHKPGQFAFAASDPAEGPHPYTIASAWDAQERRISFVARELGDHTRTLSHRLRLGQQVMIEGPYGCFTFDDDRIRQIWVAGGIGITPFIARMDALARQPDPGRSIDLFHCSAEVDDHALARLTADAEAANIRLHILIDARDGLLTGSRIRAAVPAWNEASIWFCGPSAFGDSLRRDFAAEGFPVEAHFHQELFSMR